MELRQALIEQYHAGLAMLGECVAKCPDDLWLEGEHPRAFWCVAWHAAYFTQNYLVQDEEAFNSAVTAWPAAVRTALGVSASQTAVDVEPFELPLGISPPTRQELGDYIAHISGLVGETVKSLRLDSPETGFSWYPNMTKLSHELMNLRHLQGHVGQLSERLMMRGIDIDWVGKLDNAAV